jgi:hypothetical protein
MTGRFVEEFPLENVFFFCVRTGDVTGLNFLVGWNTFGFFFYFIFSACCHAYKGCRAARPVHRGLGYVQ